MGILLNTSATEDFVKFGEPVRPELPQEAKDAISAAGYRPEIVIENDTPVNLDTEGDEQRPQVTETTLHNNKLWIDSARALIPLFRKDGYGDLGEEDEEVSDLEAAQWGIELMGQFNWDLTDMASMVYQMQDSSPRERYAFYNLMQSYDQLPNFTYDGSVRMFKGLASDWTTYLGLGTLGAGFLARLGAKQAGKTGLKNYLRSTLPAAAVAGIEGGTFTGLDDALRQTVTMRADQQDEYDYGRTAFATGIGTVGGTTAGFVFPKVGEIAVRGVKEFYKGLKEIAANARSTAGMGVAPTDTNITKGIDVQNRELRQRKRIQLSPQDRQKINSLSSEKTIPAKDIEAEYRRMKELYPERDGWAKFTIKDVKKVKGNLEIEVDKQAYGFNRPKGAKQAPTEPDPKLVANATKKMVSEVEKLFARANKGDKTAQNIIEHKTWYSQMRDQLRAEFGSMADVFADVIGATSAQTNVRQNWENSIDVMQNFTRGNYDEALSRLQEWMDAGGKLGSGKPENDGYVDLHMRVRQEAIANGATKEEAFQAGQAAYPLITKSNGKLINANSPQTMMALLDMFRQKTTGGSPKTFNFTGNLIGYSDLATIDVWAGRFLQRMSGGKRLIPKQEQGVSGGWLKDMETAGGEFGFGQEVFSQASRALKAKGIDLADDDLQAVVWFMEKELWAQKGYTTKAGEGGSLEFEAALAGAPDQEAIAQARKDIDTDPSFRQREQIKELIADPKAQETFETQKARLAELDGFVAAQTPLQKRKYVTENLGIEDREAADAQVKTLRKEVSFLKREIKKREALQPRLDRLTEKKETATAEGEQLLRDQAAPVRRFTGGISLDTEQKIATNPEMSDAQKRLMAPLEPDPSVVSGKATSSIGRYIDPDNEIFDERTIDFEYVARQDHDPSDVVKQLVQEAKDADQESTFFSEVVKPNTVEGANGGIELYFNRDLKREDVEKITEYINKQKLGAGFTFATDFRFAERTSQGAEVGDYVGLRVQYIPEFGGGQEGMAEAIDKMQALVDTAPEDMDFISNIRYSEYDTEVFFRDAGDYDAELTGSVRQSRKASWRR